MSGENIHHRIFHETIWNHAKRKFLPQWFRFWNQTIIFTLSDIDVFVVFSMVVKFFFPYHLTLKKNGIFFSASLKEKKDPEYLWKPSRKKKSGIPLKGKKKSRIPLKTFGKKKSRIPLKTCLQEQKIQNSSEPTEGFQRNSGFFFLEGFPEKFWIFCLLKRFQGNSGFFFPWRFSEEFWIFFSWKGFRGILDFFFPWRFSKEFWIFFSLKVFRNSVFLFLEDFQRNAGFFFFFSKQKKSKSIPESWPWDFLFFFRMV